MKDPPIKPLIKLATALVRLLIQEKFGVEIPPFVLDELANLSSEVISEKVDVFLKSKWRASQVLLAFADADRCFNKNTADSKHFQMIQDIPVASEKELLKLARQLPETLDFDGLSTLLRCHFSSATSQVLSPEQLDQIVAVYRHCFIRALSIRCRQMWPAIFDHLDTVDAHILSMTERTQNIEALTQSIASVNEQLLAGQARIFDSLQSFQSGKPKGLCGKIDGIQIILINSREGRDLWVDLLREREGLEILEEHYSLYEGIYAVGERHPDVLLVSGQLLHRRSDARAVIQASKRLGVWTKVVIVADNPEEVKRALIFGADEAILYPFEPEELVHLIIGLCREPKRQCDQLVEELEDSNPGRRYTSEFEEIIVKILIFLFSDKISYSGTKTLVHMGVPHRLIMFNNHSTDNFWKKLRESQGCDQVIFMLDNRYQSNRSSIEYLLKALDSIEVCFGVLIHRVLPNDDRFACQVSIQRMGFTVLLLSLEQIRTLLAFKAAGVDPTCFLQDLLVELSYLDD